MKKSILVIDDEEALVKALDRYLQSQGYEVQGFSSWEKGIECARARSFDLLLIDLMLPETSGIEVLTRIREIQPKIVSIVMTGFGTIPSAVEAIRAGAYHYVTKPFDLEDIGSLIHKALEHNALREENRVLKKQLNAKYGRENIIGVSSAMKEVLALVDKIAETDSTVLISGESGTGKELIAQAIHHCSRRAENPFVAVNCAAIPEGLLESELFGHMKGSFTGAIATRSGKFEQADRGTLFLDEVGDMSPKLQVKVLRVLQERQVQPVGSSRHKDVDIRVVAATNQDLEKAVAEGRFREDLYYRLNVLPILIPPLRDRPEDIVPLAQFLLKKIAAEESLPVTRMSREAMDLLVQYPWPGNVRELENTLQRLVVLKKGDEIVREDLNSLVTVAGRDKMRLEIGFPEEGIDLRQRVSEYESDLIRKAMEQCDGNKNKAAQLLKLNRTTLIEKLKKLELVSGSDVEG